jgi:hypothetical protein
VCGWSEIVNLLVGKHKLVYPSAAHLVRCSMETNLCGNNYGGIWVVNSKLF